MSTKISQSDAPLTSVCLSAPDLLERHHGLFLALDRGAPRHVDHAVDFSLLSGARLVLGRPASHWMGSAVETVITGVNPRQHHPPSLISVSSLSVQIHHLSADSSRSDTSSQEVRPSRCGRGILPGDRYKSMTRNPIPFLVGRVSSDFRFCSSPNNSPRPLQRLDYPSDTAGDTGTLSLTTHGAPQSAEPPR